MGYTWENVTRIHGASATNLGRHMKLHPCCKKQTKKAVVHPLTNRPLIVNALPVELQARILLHFGENPPQFYPFPRPLESIFEVQNDNVAEQDQEQENEALAVYHEDEADVYPNALEENLNVNFNDDIDFDGNIPAIDVHLDNRLPPLISPEELLRLQAQAAESVRLQEALDAALLDVQRLITERDVVTNIQADVARSLQETQVSLQTKTQENANLVQLQEELNGRLKVLTSERELTKRDQSEHIKLSNVLKEKLTQVEK
ncbi:hypothetical protein HDV02_005693, partial [Globomyces sp. JEL0801]